MKFIKKIIILSIVFLIVFLLYIFNIDKKINYMSLGNSLILDTNSYKIKKHGYSDYIVQDLVKFNTFKSYINDYNKINYTIPELINDIKLNKKIIKENQEIGIKKSISESDLITLDIGNEEMIRIINKNIEECTYKNMYTDINEIINEMDELIREIRNYYNKDLIIIGYYYPNTNNNNKEEIEKIYNYINLKFLELTKKHKCKYINIYSLLKENTNNDINHIVAQKILNN